MDTASTTAALPRLGLLALIFLCGCSTAYYNAMEQVGQHKRDILRSRIEAGQEDQLEAQEQFKTTYERFSEVTGHDGGNLEATYNQLSRDYEMCESRSQDVSDRIQSIEEVASDLFKEWEAEIGLIQNPKLRAARA
jgi:hypothetical protein